MSLAQAASEKNGEAETRHKKGDIRREREEKWFICRIQVQGRREVSYILFTMKCQGLTPVSSNSTGENCCALKGCMG